MGIPLLILACGILQAFLILGGFFSLLPWPSVLIGFIFSIVGFVWGMIRRKGPYSNIVLIGTALCGLGVALFLFILILMVCCSILE